MISRFLAAISLACLIILAIAVPVLGHAELVESDPPDGGTIQTDGGYTFTATFTEELLEDSGVVVRNSAGEEVATGGTDPDDAAVLTAELPELEPGDYAARWTAISDDGHTERGTITFSVGAAASTPEPTPVPTEPASEAPSATAPSAPTASQAPTATASPAPTSTPGPTNPTSSNNDIILALALAAIAIGGVVAIIFMRGRD